MQIRPADLFQDGIGLLRSSEQVHDQGSINRSLNDFSQPLDLNLSGYVPGSMTARVDERRFVSVQLSNADRAQCLDNSNFAVNFRVVGPTQNAFSAIDVGCGELRVINFNTSFTGSNGGNCPRSLIYGYILDLLVDGAVSPNDYQGTVEITVEQLGLGGGSTSVQIPLLIDMPSVLLLYHYSQINIDMQASAIAGALGSGVACNGGQCMDVGYQSASVAILNNPIIINIGADAPPFTPVQTITLRNAVGARAVGCSGDVYGTATYQILNPIGGIQARSGVIAGIQNQSCGFVIRTGDLAFDLDLNIANSNTNATASIQIIVVGL